MAREHHTWLGKFLASIGSIFSGGLKGVAKTSVAITEEFKTLINGGFISGVAKFIDDSLKTHLAETTIASINLAIPKVLAVELAIEGLPENPTEADVLAFEDSVYKAVTGLDPVGTSKLYTELSAQIYGIIKPQIDAHKKLTFADIVADVEEAYQAYQKDLEETTP